MKKFILHTNYPGHYDFSIYNRCEFRIQIPERYRYNYNGVIKLAFCYSSIKQDLEYDQLIIDPRSDWSHITDRLSEPISKPVNLRRTSSANNTNPWGSTVSSFFGVNFYQLFHLGVLQFQQYDL